MAYEDVGEVVGLAGTYDDCVEPGLCLRRESPGIFGTTFPVNLSLSCGRWMNRPGETMAFPCPTMSAAIQRTRTGCAQHTAPVPSSCCSLPPPSVGPGARALPAADRAPHAGGWRMQGIIRFHYAAGCLAEELTALQHDQAPIIQLAQNMCHNKRSLAAWSRGTPDHHTLECGQVLLFASAATCGSVEAPPSWRS